MTPLKRIAPASKLSWMPAIHQASSAIAGRSRRLGLHRSTRGVRQTKALARDEGLSMSSPSGRSSASLCRPEYRGQGVAQALLKGAIAYARKQGATLVEAYPVDKPARSKDDYMWFGAKSMYDKAGFKEVARRKPHRPIVRIRPA